MHDTATRTTTARSVDRAAMAAITTVAAAVRTHALNQVVAYTAQAERAAADPNASTEAVHREQAPKWACTARENGATEHQITPAYHEGHHPG